MNPGSVCVLELFTFADSRPMPGWNGMYGVVTVMSRGEDGKTFLERARQSKVKKRLIERGKAGIQNGGLSGAERAPKRSALSAQGKNFS